MHNLQLFSRHSYHHAVSNTEMLSNRLAITKPVIFYHILFIIVYLQTINGTNLDLKFHHIAIKV